MLELSAGATPLLRRAGWPLVLPPLGYAIFVSKSLFVDMNPDWALLLLGWAAGATGLAWWLTRPEARPLLDGVERYAGRLAMSAIVVAAIASVTVSILQARYFASGAHAEDTAYYSQVLWNTLQGDFLAGNLQQERLYRPPVSNDFALHVSGVLLGILPLYGIFPHFLTLLIVRDLALAAAAWPLYLIARERMGGTAGVAAVVLYLANPAVIAQSVGAFYPLQLAPLPFFWALRAFLREAFRPFLVWMAAAISTREDVAISVAGFGLLALIRGRSLRWLAVGFGLPVAWWALVTLVIQPAFGRWGNNVVEITFAGGSQAPFGLYQVLLDPAAMLERFREEGLYYVYQMLRSVAFLAVLGGEWILALPGLAANLLFARMFYPAGDPFSRFALLPACALVGAAVVVVSRLAHKPHGDIRALSVVFLLLLPSVSLLDGVKDAVKEWLGPNTVQAQLGSYREADVLWEAVSRVPEAASVAAPHYALPALSYRSKLYYVQHLSEYPQAEPDFILLDRNLDRVTRTPTRRERYVALLDTVSHSKQYETVWQQRDFLLVRRIDRAP